MQAAGATLLEDLTQLAVMWIVEAVLNVDKFWKLLRRAEAYFAEERPDAVVLIDYPGFNWWIAQSQEVRHSGLLLRRTSDVGLGWLADSETTPAGRSRALQIAV